MRVEALTDGRVADWDAYVDACAKATIFHRAAFRDVIARATGHKPVYRFAERDGRVVGVLPLFLLDTGVFGKLAVSSPFLNIGGIAADDAEAEAALAAESEKLGREFGASYMEWRQRYATTLDLPVSDRKVTSLIPLTGGADEVFARVHQNVRNKIRKAEKNGVVVEKGPQFLDDFYRVYSRNLRDLGTPVISRKFFAELQRSLPDAVGIYRATLEGRLIGAKVVVTDKTTCYFVWAAAVREELKFAPVHALNWAAIRDACEAGCDFVDFGRSSPDSTHQSFKKYWGVDVEPLPWTYQLLTRSEMPGLNPDNPKFALAIRIWKKLPVWLTRWIGPPLARRLP
ncbi:FemAB family PEP-CTERM system-associated protein [bacterium]|nr:FemAB family PEP-CTERM system-associated protein [bacterium]